MHIVMVFVLDLYSK